MEQIKLTEIECDDNCISRNIGYHKCDKDCQCKCGVGVHAVSYLHIQLQWDIDSLITYWKDSLVGHDPIHLEKMVSLNNSISHKINKMIELQGKEYLEKLKN